METRVVGKNDKDVLNEPWDMTAFGFGDILILFQVAH